MAAQEDLIGLAMSNVDTNMTAPGARGAVIGNNPLALLFRREKNTQLCWIWL